MTELWQPLAAELHRDTLLCLVSLAISLLTGNRGRREIVAAVCTLRLLTVHLLLFARCQVNVAVMLPSTAAPSGEVSDGLRTQLLDRLLCVLLHPVSRVDQQLQELWGCMQGEAVCTLIAGMGAFFPLRHSTTALLYASLGKHRVAEDDDSTSPWFVAYINALMQWLSAQPLVSLLFVTGEHKPNQEPKQPTAAELQAAVPRALSPALVELKVIQSALRDWILSEVVAEARRCCSAARTPPDPSASSSEALRLLAAIAQEVLGRASLCNDAERPENQQLLELASSLVTHATEVLTDLPTPNHVQLAELQLRLANTFIGSLLPWVADALALFSAHAFEYSQRLLPRVMALLNTLQRIVAADAELRKTQPASAVPQTAQPVPIESAHPYKQQPAAAKVKGRARVVMQPTRSEERHEWPGASQLRLKFNSRCCTDEGDWLTLTFYKEGREVPGRSVRLGGAWANWPRTLTVPADSVRVSFSHAESHREEDFWGYAFQIVAAKRWSADPQGTPSLVQLQTSLVYLGAKYASVLALAEPVIDEEKENRQWLASPLLNRGLPMQLPRDHPLMHDFFGINLNQEGGGSAEAKPSEEFLDDLVHLSGSDATKLHACDAA